MTAVAASLVVGALLWSGPAAAGQLHVTRFGLEAVIQRHGFVLAATVSKVDAKGGKVTARIDRVWAVPGKEPRRYRVKSSSAFAVYTGIKWTNPRVSPIDNRLWSSVPLTQVKPGQPILLVPVRGAASGPHTFEVAPGGAPADAKLAVLFSEAGKKEYLRQAPKARLARNLKDFDLFKLAHQTLMTRRLADAATILAAHDRRSREPIVRYHLDQLKPAARRQFLRQARAVVTKEPTLLKPLVDAVTDRLEPRILPEVAAIASLIDGRDHNGLRLMEHFALYLQLFLEKHPSSRSAAFFSKFMVAHARVRPNYRLEMKALRKFMTFLKGRHRGALAKEILAVVRDTSRSKDAGVDLGLLAIAAELVTQQPSPSYVPLIEKIDPLGARIRSTRSTILEYVMTMAVRIGERTPRAVRPLAPTIEKSLAQQVEVPEALLRRWRRIVPAKP